MSNFIQRFEIYSGEVEPKGTAPELQVKTRLFRGRKVAPVPQWFNSHSKVKTYISCSFIKFTVIGGDTYYLVWPYSSDAQLKAHWDELKNEVVIDDSKHVKHIALFCEDRQTLLKTWVTSATPGVKPTVRVLNATCPGDDTVIQCWSIPRLPTLGSTEPKAPKSTEILGVCVDINALSTL